MKKDIIDSLEITNIESSLRLLTEPLEPYRNSVSSLTKSLSKIMKTYSMCSENEIVESIRKTRERYEKMYKFAFSEDQLQNSMKKSTELITKAMRMYDQMDVFKASNRVADSLNAISKSLNINIEQLRALQKLDYSSIFTDIVTNAASLPDIVEEAYTLIQDELDDENDVFTEEEIQDALKEQMTNSKNFQVRISEWTEKKKMQFFIIWQLILFIYGNFFQPYFQENIGVPVTAYVVSNVKELPEKGAKIIGKIQKNVEAIITENTNYYYKVIYTDEKGEKREGYVAKRNLRVIDNVEEDDLKKEVQSKYK